MEMKEALDLIRSREQAIDFLREMSRLDGEHQQPRSTEIDAAFDVFWGEIPTREEFANTMRGVILTPRILWTMCRVNGMERGTPDGGIP